jgi:hypothetical protein
MKTLLAAPLILALGGWTLPVMARERDGAIGSIARSVAEHAGRLGASSARTRSGRAPDAGGTAAPATEWERIQHLEPGTEITIILRDSRVVRFFLFGDESSLTVLSRADPLTRIVIPRQDVVEVRRQPATHVGRHTRRGALVGVLAGAALMLVAAGSIEGSHSGSDTAALAGAGTQRAAPRLRQRLQHGQVEPIRVSETEVACAPRRIDGLGIESAAAGLDAIRNGIDVLGCPEVDGEAEALDTVPSLGAVILVQVDADVAGFERDEDKPALPLERTVDTEAHNVLVPGGTLLNVFHGDRNGGRAVELFWRRRRIGHACLLESIVEDRVWNRSSRRFGSG